MSLPMFRDQQSFVGERYDESFNNNINLHHNCNLVNDVEFIRIMTKVNQLSLPHPSVLQC